MESDEALSHLDSRTFYTMLIAIFSVSALLAGRCLVNQVFIYQSLRQHERRVDGILILSPDAIMALHLSRHVVHVQM
jgi:hypothetical protein